MSILEGNETGRRSGTLFAGETSVYDEGKKEDYIESNRLLDYAAEFLWKAKEKAVLVQVSGLNKTKPPFNYEKYYGERE